MTEREAYIALNMMEKVGPVSVKKLVSALGTASSLFEARHSELSAVEGVGPAVVKAFIEQRERIDWKGEIAAADDKQVNIVSRIDPEYPVLLQEIHDPPLALYVRGALKSGDSRALAFVGTRRPTYYGKDVVSELVSGTVQAGFTVISGLARGIDTMAHKAALESGGRTLAIMGGGFNRIYPSCNEGLADDISRSGAVITEFPMDKPPDRTTFPMRNRIISGMSEGVIVVEAGIKSGSLITANQALQQGRSVFAVPGRIDSAVSRGANDLIRKGAVPVTCTEDILEDFEFSGMPVNRREQKNLPLVELTDDEQKIITTLECGEMDVDGIIRRTGLKSATVAGLLLQMEMKQLVRMLPGKMVEAIQPR